MSSRFPPIANVDVHLTRASDGTVTSYVGGARQFSFVDVDKLAVVDGDNRLRFFIDDSGEHAVGAVSRIILYKGVVPPDETPTPTATHTPTATLTKTPTATHTKTPTHSTTSTATATVERTPTDTATASPTHTTGPTISPTPTSPIPGECGYLAGVAEWNGTFSFRYNNSARGVRPNGVDTSVNIQHAGTVEVRFSKPNAGTFPTSWTDETIDGPAQIDDTYIEHPKQGEPFIDTIAGGGDVRPARGGTLDTHATLNIDPETCTYNFQVGTRHPALRTTFGNTGEVTPLFAYQIVALDVPEESYVLAGSRPIPATVRLTDPNGYIGGGFMQALNEIVGQDDMGDALISWSITPVRLGQEPVVELDRELLERSIFLSEVPVDDEFISTINWGDAGQGYLTWRIGTSKPDRVGQTTSQRIPRVVEIEKLPVGTTQVHVQGHNDLPQHSKPQTSQIVVAKVLEWCGKISDIVAIKMGQAVQYRCSFKWPEPAFEGTKTVPSFVPFFGGKPIGIKETQIGADLEVKSTSEGSVKGGGQSGFAVGKGTVIIAVAVKGDVKLDPSGVSIPSAALEFAVSGKIGAEEALVKLVPQFAAAVESIRTVWPEATDAITSRAKACVEVELKGSPTFNFSRNTAGDVEWTGVDGGVGLGIKGTVQIIIVEDKLSMGIFAGGEGVATWTLLPSPSFKQADGKIMGGYKINLLKYLYEGEKAWTWSTASGLTAREDGRWNPYRNSAEPALPTQTGGWKLIDRSYLTAADYARWTGGTVPAGQPTDQQVVQNVGPLADPVLAAAQGNEYIVWAQDTPGAAAWGGDELMFGRGMSTNWGGGPTPLTDDAVSDLNPQLVTLPDGKVLVVWERFDQPDPGDINGDGRALFSHMQVAAGSFDPLAVNPSVALLQLSQGGSLNHRPQLGALRDGALAVWVNNPANAILGSAAHPDTLMWARLDAATNTWTPAATLRAAIPGMTDYALATRGEHAAVVWTQDMDGTSATTADRELFWSQLRDGAWSATTRLTSNSVEDTLPNLELANSGTPFLVWQQGTTLRFLRGAWSGAPVALPFALDQGQHNWELARGTDGSLALTWQQPSGGDTVIGYAIYDGAAQQWSDSRTVVPPRGTHATTSTTSAMVTDVAPVLRVGESGTDHLVLAYHVADITSPTRTIDGQFVPNAPVVGAQHLRIAHVPLAPNLAIFAADLHATPVGAQAGAPITIATPVRNTGEVGIAGAKAELIRRPVAGGGDEVLATKPVATLAAGSVFTVTFGLARPTEAAHLYRVRLVPPDGVEERTTTDNEATLGAELALRSLPPLYDVPGGATIRADLAASGGIPPAGTVTGTLTLDEPDGRVLAVFPVAFPVTPSATMPICRWLSLDDLGAGRHRVFLNVNPAATLSEADRDDNSVQTTVEVLPDLTTEAALVEWKRAAGASAPVKLWVRNAGTWRSTGGTVAIYDTPPGTPTRHTEPELG